MKNTAILHLSAFHFQRAFTLLTDMSPAEYLRKRRLSQAGSQENNRYGALGPLRF